MDPLRTKFEADAASRPEPAAAAAVCPECGAPASQREPAPIVSWLDRRFLLPRMAVVIALAAAVFTALWPPRPPWVSPARANVYSALLGKGVTVAGLNDPPAGDAWTRELAERIEGGRRSNAAVELSATILGPSDRAVWYETVVQGWPITTVNRSRQADVADVGALMHQGTLPQDWVAVATAPWSPSQISGRPILRMWNRTVGTASDVYWLDLTMVLLALLVADGLRRLVRAGLRCAGFKGRVFRTAPLVAAAAVLAAAAGSMLWPTNTTSHLTIWQFGGVTGVLPLALTNDEIENLVGREDADAVLAAAMRDALAAESEDAIVCVMVTSSAQLTSTLRWYGAWWRDAGPHWGLVYVSTGSRTVDGETVPLQRQGLQLRGGGTGVTFIELPHREGATKGVGIGFDHGLIALMLAGLWIVGVGGAMLARLIPRAIARRRASRGRCVICGYPLQSATGVP